MSQKAKNNIILESDENQQGLEDFKQNALQQLVIEKALALPEANNCTYTQGYITQECFVCLTCFNETKKLAIICLACSLRCHDESHEMISIGFKRHMRCDCGNNNFYLNCQLKKNIEISYDNPENKYGHNMQGKYCYCNEEEDEKKMMIQCFFCEDWYHIEHLNYFGKGDKDIKTEEENDKNIICEKDIPYMDLICKNCIKVIKNILLGHDLKKFIHGLMPKKDINSTEEEKDINFFSDNDNNNTDNKLLSRKRKLERNNNFKDTSGMFNKIKKNINCKYHYDKNNEQFYDELILQEEEILFDSSLFLKNICKCEKCKKNYIKCGVGFLVQKNCIDDWENRKSFDEIINDEKFIEDAQKKSTVTINSLEDSIKDYFKSKEYHRLSFEKQNIIQNCAVELANRFGEYVTELDHDNLTIEDMYIFFLEYKKRLEELKSE